MSKFQPYWVIAVTQYKGTNGLRHEHRIRVTSNNNLHKLWINDPVSVTAEWDDHSVTWTKEEANV